MGLKQWGLNMQAGSWFRTRYLTALCPLWTAGLIKNLQQSSDSAHTHIETPTGNHTNSRQAIQSFWTVLLLSILVGSCSVYISKPRFRPFRIPIPFKNTDLSH